MSVAAPPLAYDLPTPPQVHTLRSRATVVGVAAALLAWARGKREAGAAENATANV